jgi:phage FluMu gp28-like protein
LEGRSLRRKLENFPLYRSYKQRRALRRLPQIDKAIRQLQFQEALTITGPVEFAEKILSTKPFPYQTALLQDPSKRIVACMGRQTGKTTTIALKAIYFAHTNKSVTVLITSPSLRQSMIMFERITSLVFSSLYLRGKITRATGTLIQFENRSKIIALPCSENMLRGYTANMIILDEASWIPEKVITQILFPMLTTTDGYAILLSTPWDKNHFFYRAFVNPAYSVHRVKSSQCPLVTEQILEENRQNMTHDGYLMEYEAEFVEALNSYFPQALIRSSVELAQKLGVELYSFEASFPRGEYFAGLDFGKLQDYSVLTVLRREANTLKLVYMHQFSLETPYTQVIGHLIRANQRFQFRCVLVDQTGVGEPVLEEIRNQGLYTVKGLTFTVQSKEDLLTGLKIAMEQNRIAIPYDRLLCQQINEQQYEYSKSGHLQFNHPQHCHDDMLWALALATAGITRTPPPGSGAVMGE